MAISATSDFTLHDLYRSLDERRRPEDAARMILGASAPSGTITATLRTVAEHARRYSYMSQGFPRSFASLDKQAKVAGVLFAATVPADTTDVGAVHEYLARIEAHIG